METKTVQVVLDKKLLRAANRAARRQKTNRSALIREALRAHLKRLDILEKEERERAGYAKHPDDDSAIWDIPGMRESIRRGLRTPLSKTSEKPGW